MTDHTTYLASLRECCEAAQRRVTALSGGETSSVRILARGDVSEKLRDAIADYGVALKQYNAHARVYGGGK